jgi:hypothetical protein
MTFEREVCQSIEHIVKSKYSVIKEQKGRLEMRREEQPRGNFLPLGVREKKLMSLLC